MSWKDDQKEKFEEFFALAISLILDALLVLLVAGLAASVKYLIETFILHEKIAVETNPAVYGVYTLSKVFIVSGCSLYVLLDLISHVQRIIRKIRGK